MYAVIQYLKRIVAWKWRVFLFVSGPLIAIGLPVIAALLWPTELGFRAVGFFLQVLGAWIVWVGIRGTRERYQVPGFFRQSKALLADFPRFRRHVTISAGSGTITLSGATGRAYGWHGVAEGAPIEQRVVAMEANLKNVSDDLHAHKEQSDDRDRANKDEMKRERAEREASDDAIHDKIKEAETGGLHLNWSGVWWLFSGTLCSTFPEELAHMFGGS